MRFVLFLTSTMYCCELFDQRILHSCELHFLVVFWLYLFCWKHALSQRMLNACIAVATQAVLVQFTQLQISIEFLNHRVEADRKNKLQLDMTLSLKRGLCMHQQASGSTNKLRQRVYSRNTYSRKMELKKLNRLSFRNKVMRTKVYL